MKVTAEKGLQFSQTDGSNHKQTGCIYISLPPRKLFNFNLLHKKRTEAVVLLVKLARNITFHPRKIITFQKIDMVYFCSFKTGFYSQSYLFIEGAFPFFRPSSSRNETVWLVLGGPAELAPIYKRWGVFQTQILANR